MKRFLIAVMLAGLVFGLFCSQQDEQNQASSQKVMLQAGDPAPEFSLRRTSDRERITLGEILQAGPVLLAFYPVAFSPG